MRCDVNDNAYDLGIRTRKCAPLEPLPSSRPAVVPPKPPSHLRLLVHATPCQQHSRRQTWSDAQNNIAPPERIKQVISSDLRVRERDMDGPCRTNHSCGQGMAFDGRSLPTSPRPLIRI